MSDNKEKQRKRIITAALIYSNGFPHLGHIASTFLPADIYARFSKIKYGKDNVVFVSGSDEHGTPIELSALKHNLSPEEFVKIFRREHKKDLKKLNIMFDNFYYTHSPENKRLVEDFYEKAKKKGLIYKKEIDALFCEHCNRFLPDRFVKGTCPYCHAPNQYGDVCEVCGRTYTAKELIDPKCILCGNAPILKTTSHLFFALSKLQKEIEEYLLSYDLQEDAKNYALSWMKEGLKDIDITRDAPYFGFPVPDMPNKFFYVWVDAPYGYIASCINHNPSLMDWWKDHETEIIHFMGKDIVYFHYIYWIAMLITSGFSLPKKMPIRGFLTLNKKKMSKSRGNFIYLRDLLEFFDPCYVRYYFARNIPDDIHDGDFSFDTFKDKINKELIGTIVNLGYRVLKIGEKIKGYSLKEDIVLDDYDVFKEVDDLLERFLIKAALERILNFAIKINEKFNAYEPWKLVDKEEERGKIDELFKDVVVLFALLEPYLPTLSQKFYDLVGVERSNYKLIKVKGKLKEPQVLLRKIDENMFSFVSGKDEFSKLDLKVGLIEDVKDIKESEKLYYLTLDVGDGKKKRVVAGIKKHYSINDLKGKKVVFINNLKKSKIMGYESEGMLLACSSADGNEMGLLVVEDPLIISGSDVIIKGVFKNPKEKVTIDNFRKIELVKQGKNVVYKGHKLIARSIAREREVEIERAEKIEDGARIW